MQGSGRQRRAVYDVHYHYARRTNRPLRYRLWRRTEEVRRALQKHLHVSNPRVLDIGTADGLMMDSLTSSLDPSILVGIDLSLELLRMNRNPSPCLLQADAVQMPFQDASFDLLIATAVLEHVTNPNRMLEECFRIARDGGLLIITTPHPFWERVAVKIGHLREEQHYATLNIPTLRRFLTLVGFKVIDARKFMLSPIGFPLEKALEGGLRFTGFDLLLLNQFVVAEKVSEG